MRRLFVAPEVQSLLRLGVALLEEVVVADPDPALWEEVARLAERLRERYAGWEPGQIPGLEPARALYRAVGEDPTKRRPSSEALLRRLLRGDDLYRVNTLVDVGNWCSVEFLLPISVLDLGQTEGAIVVRRGAPGEAYQAIGREPFRVEGRLVVADARGAIGNPTADSTRTMVTTGTRRALALIYAPADYAVERLEAHAATLGARAVRFNRGRCAWTGVLGAGVRSTADLPG